MGRRTSLIGVLVTSHARRVRERKAQERHRVAQVKRHEQVRAASARALAAEHRATELVANRRREHRAAYDRACAQHTAEHLSRISEAKEAHAKALSAHEENRRQRDAEVTALETAYGSGEVESIVLYNEMVLARSDYPVGFSEFRRAAYQWKPGSECN